MKKGFLCLAVFLPSCLLAFQEMRFEERERDGYDRRYGFLEGPHSEAIDFENIGTYLRRHEAWQREEQERIWRRLRDNPDLVIPGIALQGSGQSLAISGSHHPELLNTYFSISKIGMVIPDYRFRETIREDLWVRGMSHAEIQLLFDLMAKENLIEGNLEIGPLINRTYQRLFLSRSLDEAAICEFLEMQRQLPYDTYLEWAVTVMELLPVRARRVLVSFLAEKYLDSPQHGTIRFGSLEDSIAAYKAVMHSLEEEQIEYPELLIGDAINGSKKRYSEGIARAQQRAQNWARAVAAYQEAVRQ